MTEECEEYTTISSSSKTEVRRCFNGQKCHNDRENCGILSSIQNYETANNGLKESIKLNNLNKYFNSDSMRKIAANCFNRTQVVSVGDRKIYSKLFTDNLKEFIENINIQVVQEQNLLLKDEYKDIVKNKRVDLIVGSKRKIYIEIKGWANINSLGEALIEGILLKKEEGNKFIVVFSSAPKSEDYIKYKKLVYISPFSDYIDELFILELSERGMEDLIAFRKYIKENT
ncbi:MAG: hypothetical protein A2452_11175 [Candidatus Firestonebacteria bacterium RIFOXYC2_FULL_39_67]|nr:MAG: hypothetical protein A2452_11175 [Candidatus Firestonebacteria bacterium RIFOXYC2_FULL_39_67]